eukprot:s1725_g8.t1
MSICRIIESLGCCDPTASWLLHHRPGQYMRAMRSEYTDPNGVFAFDPNRWQIGCLRISKHDTCFEADCVAIF